MHMDVLVKLACKGRLDHVMRLTPSTSLRLNSPLKRVTPYQLASKINIYPLPVWAKNIIIVSSASSEIASHKL